MSSRRSAIIVDEPAAAFVADDVRRGVDSRCGACRRSVVQSLVRPFVPIMVVREGDQGFLQCLLVQPDRLAGEAGLEGAEPAFDETVAPGHAGRCPFDDVASVFQGLPEAGGEAGIAIHADGLGVHVRQEAVGGIGDLLSGLQHPGFVGMLGHAEDPHAAGVLMDGGQDQRHAHGGPEADGHLGEIDGDGVRAMLCDDLRPGPGLAALRGGGDAGAPEHAAHRAGADHDPQLFQFSDDAAMAPGIVADLVLAGEADDQIRGVPGDRGAAAAFAGLARFFDEFLPPAAAGVAGSQEGMLGGQLFAQGAQILPYARHLPALLVFHLASGMGAQLGIDPALRFQVGDDGLEPLHSLVAEIMDESAHRRGRLAA